MSAEAPVSTGAVMAPNSARSISPERSGTSLLNISQRTESIPNLASTISADTYKPSFEFHPTRSLDKADIKITNEGPVRPAEFNVHKLTDYSVIGQAITELRVEKHEQAVKEAIKEGQPVPAAEKIDYSDITKEPKENKRDLGEFSIEGQPKYESVDALVMITRVQEAERVAPEVAQVLPEVSRRETIQEVVAVQERIATAPKIEVQVKQTTEVLEQAQQIVQEAPGHDTELIQVADRLTEVRTELVQAEKTKQGLVKAGISEPQASALVAESLEKKGITEEDQEIIQVQDRIIELQADIHELEEAELKRLYVEVDPDAQQARLYRIEQAIKRVDARRNEGESINNHEVAEEMGPERSDVTSKIQKINDGSYSALRVAAAYSGEYGTAKEAKDAILPAWEAYPAGQLTDVPTRQILSVEQVDLIKNARELLEEALAAEQNRYQSLVGRKAMALKAA